MTNGDGGARETIKSDKRSKSQQKHKMLMDEALIFAAKHDAS